MSILSKRERLRIFLERMNAAAPADSADQAFILLSKTLNIVEDEFSGVSYNPLLWQNDGRMYPPLEHNYRSVARRRDLRRYRSVKHDIYIGGNGSVRIDHEPPCARRHIQRNRRLIAVGEDAG